MRTHTEADARLGDFTETFQPGEEVESAELWHRWVRWDEDGKGYCATYWFNQIQSLGARLRTEYGWERIRIHGESGWRVPLQQPAQKA